MDDAPESFEMVIVQQLNQSAAVARLSADEIAFYRQTLTTLIKLGWRVMPVETRGVEPCDTFRMIWKGPRGTLHEGPWDAMKDFAFIRSLRSLDSFLKNPKKTR